MPRARRDYRKEREAYYGYGPAKYLDAVKQKRRKVIYMRVKNKKLAGKKKKKDLATSQEIGNDEEQQTSDSKGPREKEQAKREPE